VVVVMTPSYGIDPGSTVVGSRRTPPFGPVRQHGFHAIVTDLDGTLLDPAGRVTARTATALRDARGRGVRLAAASARPLRLVEEVLGEHVALFDAFLVSNGASTVAMPGRGVLDEALVPVAAAQAIIGCVGRAWPEAAFGWEVGSRFEHDHAFAEIAARRGIVRNLEGAPTPVPATPAHQIVVAWPDGDPAQRLDAVREVCAAVVDGVVATHSAGGVVELSAAGADKAAAMRRWAELGGFGPGGVVAFGDETNDITLLRQAGLGIAMGNARDTVKAAAAALTLANSEDGVAAAVEALFAGR
jgi:Cof subfamily protein (haloacid dehalogenase superfamily)